MKINKAAKRAVKAGAILLICVMLMTMLTGCGSSYNYEKAVEYWEEGAYNNAFRYFQKCAKYEDAAAYIEEYETVLMEELIDIPWCSGLSNDGLQIDQQRWDYVFYEDGTVLRRAQVWEYTGYGYKMKTYNDSTSTYTISYGYFDGVYKPIIKVGEGKYAKEYGVVVGSKKADGSMAVLGFMGEMQDSYGKTIEDMSFSQDSHLPELD